MLLRMGTRSVASLELLRQTGMEAHLFQIDHQVLLTLPSDGASSNAITTPSSVAQADGIRQAYSQAGIDDFGQTGYFECHGTGTPTGDPIEVSAVSSVFAASRGSEDPLWIGSVSAHGCYEIARQVLIFPDKTQSGPF